MERFHSAKALANGTGLVPSFYDSGDVQVSGPITRRGSRWLCGAFATAALARRDEEDRTDSENSRSQSKNPTPTGPCFIPGRRREANRFPPSGQH
jgi:transposase